MRVSMFLMCLIIVAGALVKPAIGKEAQYVKIKKPYANVYEYLDPKSKIIRQAQKNETFELIFEGTSWYQVKVKDQVGWIERRSGSVISGPGVTVASISIGTFVMFIIFLIITFGVAAFFIYRQKTVEQ
jgi:hypothetical protein